MAMKPRMMKKKTMMRGGGKVKSPKKGKKNAKSKARK